MTETGTDRSGGLPTRVLRQPAPPPGPALTSVALYGEVLPGADGGADGVVAVRGYHAGYGKAMSRFLRSLPEAAARALRAAHAPTEAGVLAELSFDADFNANLHPPVLPAVVDYPVGRGRPGGLAFTLDALVVRRDGARGLRLVDAASGATVLPVDTGLQTWRLRPALHQLLVLFGPEARFAYPTGRPFGSGPALPAGPGVVVHAPRLTLDGRLVVRREGWAAPAAEVPVSDGGPLATVRALSAWRRTHGVPRRAYVRFRPAGPVRGPIPEDAVKPQYMDFASPPLVASLARSLRRRGPGWTLVVEERLPGPEALPRVGGAARVTETILQVAIRPGPAAPPPRR